MTAVDPCGPTQPARRVLAPGLAVTWYELARDVPYEVLDAADIVVMHTTPDRTDVDKARTLRALGKRVWMAAPGNPLADRLKSSRFVLDTLRAWADVIRAADVEVFEINAEGPSGPRSTVHWKPVDASDRVRLRERAKLILAELSAALPGVALSFTSHDYGEGHALTWDAWLGPQSPVTLHRPQHYPADKALGEIRWRTLAGRIDTSRAQWGRLARRGIVRPELVPGGAGWSPYLQGWGHTVGATCWGLDQAPLAGLWACPSSWDANGTTALRAMRAIRDEVGHAPGAVARWQRAHDLEADGIVGAATLRAMGLA